MWDKLAKVLTRGILNTAAPIVGKLTVDLAAEAAGGLIDGVAKQRSSELEARLVAQIKGSLEAFGSSEGLPEDSLDRVVDAVETLLGKRAPTLWAAASFNAERAAISLLEHGGHATEVLSGDELGLVRTALITAFNALDRERSAIDQTEVGFRRLVIDRLDALQTQQTAVQIELVADAVLTLPVRAYRPKFSPPGALLRADIDCPVPFHGREQEIIEWTIWADAPAPFSARLITGRGGMGKTRLLIELVRFLSERGWRTGFLDRAAKDLSDSVWSRTFAGGPPILLVIDYAEHQSEQIATIVRSAMTNNGRRQIRLVMLARSGADWWERLRRAGDGVGEILSGPATSRLELRPVAADIAARMKSYALAKAHFAEILGRDASAAEPDYGDPEFGRVLLLHMMALAAVDGVETKGDQGILHEMLGRERRYWERRLGDASLASVYERSLLQAMAAITLAGGASNRKEARNLVSKLPLFQGETRILVDQIVGLLHEIYTGDRWIDPVLPDLLGEHLVQVALDGEDAGAIYDALLGAKNQ